VDLGSSGLVNMLRGSTLDGVTINGNMDLVTDFPAITVRNGLTLNGDVRMAGLNTTTGSSLRFEGPDKFIDGDATISFISNAGGASVFQNDGGNLHIRSGVTIRGTGGLIGQVGRPLVHDGLIHSDEAGKIQVRGLDWINNGTLRVSGADSELATLGTWTNNSTVEAANGGKLVLTDAWHNFGTLTVTDAEVRIHHPFTIPDLGAFDFTNSMVAIEGAFTNDAGLVLDSDRFHWRLAGGTVVGGTISSADGTTFDVVRSFIGEFPTLDGVTLDADMKFVANTHLQVRNGLTLNGTIQMNGQDTINVDAPNRTISGTGRIELLSGFPTANSIIQADPRGDDDAGVMTIGPGITIAARYGRIGYNESHFGVPVSLINQGTIHAIEGLGVVTVDGVDWINDGLLKSSTDGGDINAIGNWTNNGTVHVQHGRFTAFDTWTNNGTVHVEPGSFFAKETWFNNGTLRVGIGPFIESLADFTQSCTGTFVSVVRSAIPDGYGSMFVTGTATLDGTLVVEFANVYTPSTGDSFVVLGYGDHIGEFATIETIGLDPAFQIVPNYGANGLQVAVQQQ
jgi:hypothetical protein